MPKFRAYKFEAVKDMGLTVRARCRWADDGALFLRANFGTITVQAKNAAGVETLASTSLTVASVVFDTLQVPTSDVEWTQDSTGYNFRYEVPATAFPAVGHHRIQFVFSPTTGEDGILVFEGPVRSKF
jgi:hypothetical protein